MHYGHAFLISTLLFRNQRCRHTYPDELCLPHGLQDKTEEVVQSNTGSMQGMKVQLPLLLPNDEDDWPRKLCIARAPIHSAVLSPDEGCKEDQLTHIGGTLCPMPGITIQGLGSSGLLLNLF